jgi:gliding motility-associated-like protein
VRKTLIFLLFFSILYVTAHTQPVITSFSPASGLPGTIVTISGKNFSSTPANNKVYFGAVAGTVKSASANSLEVVVPFGATYKPITVSVNGLTGYSQLPFKILFTSCTSFESNSFSGPVQFSRNNIMGAIGDIDGDGRPDFVFANLPDKCFSVLRNTGSPGSISFAAQNDFNDGGEPYGLALGDFDGDGKTDVVVTSYPYAISAYRNTSTPGNISFAPVVRLAAEMSTYSVAVTDCDLDGRPDIIVTNHDSNPGTISIFGNTSTVGALSFAPQLKFNCGNWPRNLEVGDIDGDGKPEVIIANQLSKSISILKNAGSPGTISYLPPMDIAMPAATYPESVALGDLNGDNKPDIAVANNDNPGTISILVNSGAMGTLSFNSRTDITSGKNPFRVRMEDLDGDGKTDLAVTNQETYDISVFKNTSYGGNVSFAARVDYPLPILYSPRPLSIGDFDLDGKPDLAAGIGVVTILRNNVVPNPCNSLKLRGRNSVCAGSDTVTYYATRSANCNSIIQFSIDADSSKASVISFTDTSVKVVFVQPGLVKLYAFIARSCDSLKDSVTIDVLSSPQSLHLGPDKVLCPNTSDTLKVNAGFKSYQWQDGSSDSFFVVTTPGLYYLTAINYCDEIFSDTVTIIAAPPEFIDIGNDTTKCESDTLLLSATAGFTSYIWSPDTNITSTTGPEVKVFPKAATTYKVTGTKNTGCAATASIKIDVYPSSPIRLGKDTGFCQGESIILDAGNGFLNYSWNTGAITQQIKVITTGEYIVNAEDNDHCLSTDTLKILSVFPNPLVSLPMDSALCAGTELLLNAGYGFLNYLWQDGSTSEDFHVKAIGKYWVTVTDLNQCKGSDTMEVKSILSSPINFLSSDTALCEGQPISLSALSKFPIYLWSTGETAREISISHAGRYWLQVTDDNGCTAKEYIIANSKNDCIQGIHFPNAITPNHDGINDIFKAQVFTPLKVFHMIVYNRFGIKVFETNDWHKGWDGKQKGMDVTTEIFVWYATYQFSDGALHSQKGVVTLLR